MEHERNLLSVPGRRVATVVILVLMVLVLCLVAAGPISAAPLAADQVGAAVGTWVREVTLIPRPDARVERLEPYPATGRPAAYVVHLAGGGYCLAGADDRLLPVSLYQPTDAYDSRIPDLKYLLDDYARRLERLESAAAGGDPSLSPYATILATRRDDWAALIGGRRPPSWAARKQRTVPTTLTLPLTSTWDQHSPYNDVCPVLTPGTDEHVVVGCVATAALQIMYYWQWPAAPTGDSQVPYQRRHLDAWTSTPLSQPVTIPEAFAGRLAWTAADGGHLWANGYWDDSIYNEAGDLSDDLFYEIALHNLWSRMALSTSTLSVAHDVLPIDWSSLQDDHTDPQGADDVEVAKLSFQFAVACHTQFGLWGSGSNHDESCAALADHFRYDHEAHNVTGSDDRIVEEIAWLRPVQLAGASETGGHSWVVHGYDTTAVPTEFLMNLGWGGAPVVHARDEVFPLGQSFAVFIAPAGVVRFVGAMFSGGGSPAYPFRDLAVAASEAPDGATLIFQAGSDNPFPAASVTLDRPLTLKGIDVTIRPQ